MTMDLRFRIPEEGRWRHKCEKIDSRITKVTMGIEQNNRRMRESDDTTIGIIFTVERKINKSLSRMFV